MVFSGRPSGACHACREKRLKCDRARPGCSQCARKRIACPGYRSTSELRIRDETDRVARKSLGPGRGQGGLAQEAASVHESHPDDASASETRLPGSSRALNATTDDDAVSYFMSFYIVSGPFQKYLPSMYARRQPGEDTLYTAIAAASLAAYARQTGHWGCMDRGRKSYVLALSRINAALTNPTTAVLDETLASILLLGTFESIVFPGARSPEEWTAHLIGASKLLQLRGREQFRTTTGASLFSHTATNISASCMQRFANLPDEFQALSGMAEPFLDRKDFGNRMSPILKRVIHIKARISNYPSNRAVLYDVFDDAAALERDTAALLEVDDPELGYTVRSKEDTPPWAYQGIAYRYKSPRAPKIWNTLRMVRLFLFEVMSAGASLAIDRIQQYSSETHHSGSETPRDAAYFVTVKEDAHRLAAEVATEVVGCLPEFIEPTPAGSRFSAFSRTMIWPLSVIHKNRVCPPQVREYARSMANEIVKDLDKLHFLDSKKVINGPESAEDWLHLYHVD